MTKISYTDKALGGVFTHLDANEIKTSVNTLYDDVSTLIYDVSAGSSIITIVEHANDYVLVSSDANKHHRMTKDTSTSFTISDVFTAGEACSVEQAGNGRVTFIAGVDVSIKSADSLVNTRVQYSGASILRTATIGEYLIFGDLAE